MTSSSSSYYGRYPATNLSLLLAVVSTAAYRYVDVYDRRFTDTANFERRGWRWCAVYLSVCLLKGQPRRHVRTSSIGTYMVHATRGVCVFFNIWPKRAVPSLLGTAEVVIRRCFCRKSRTFLHAPVAQLWRWTLLPCVAFPCIAIPGATPCICIHLPPAVPLCCACMCVS